MSNAGYDSKLHYQSPEQVGGSPTFSLDEPSRSNPSRASGQTTSTYPDGTPRTSHLTSAFGSSADTYPDGTPRTSHLTSAFGSSADTYPDGTPRTSHLTSTFGSSADTYPDGTPRTSHLTSAFGSSADTYPDGTPRTSHLTSTFGSSADTYPDGTLRPPASIRNTTTDGQAKRTDHSDENFDLRMQGYGNEVKGSVKKAVGQIFGFHDLAQRGDAEKKNGEYQIRAANPGTGVPFHKTEAKLQAATNDMHSRFK
ncbi:hypothetical protein IWQ60_000598 [Tieghemiomyces parasiticus]|uniref:Uncharacterized protein n=1 Tax=Tieghemiomyces parasiticus TaxID=78921 RepID=A0A9W8DZ27_9FUNG|nr:hypothetical protein IWQ60_000598 [Tieghemiomyces parasiticus]